MAAGARRGMTVGTTRHAPIPRRDALLVGGAVLVVSIAAFFRVPLLPTIGSELRMSVSQLGLITTVFALGRLATDVPAGRLGDRVPALTMLGAAGAVLALGSGAVATARVGPQVIAAAFVLGIGSAIANTTGMVFFSRAQSPERRGRSLAWFSSALLVGQALGPTFGGGIATLTDWRTTLAIAAGVGAMVLVVGVSIDRVRAGRHRDRPGTVLDDGHPPATTTRRGTDASLIAPDAVVPGGASTEAASDGTMMVGSGPPGPGAPRLQLLLLNGVGFAMMFMLGAMPQTLVPVIGAEGLALTPGRIGLALGLGGLCRLVGALVGGRISDVTSRRAALLPGLGLTAVGVAVLALDLGLAGWLLAIVLMSLGSYGISVAATMLADHSFGARMGRRLGAYRFVGDIGLILGPALGAQLYERAGPDVAVLMVAAVPASVGVACAFLLTETRWLHEHATDRGQRSHEPGPHEPEPRPKGPSHEEPT